jgi:lipopolysaccharide transport system ATP-binding protein
MIKLIDFDLNYSALAFTDKSFKTLVIDRMRGRARAQDIKALKGVNLEIVNGERIALLGHNGAGKSTLLKAIASLYPPASGKLLVEGKVRALFELHLGFELDATGRENIKYRAYLLGAKPTDIPDLEVKVIDFAQLGDRIDSPIRTYSSGMLVRLAFGIASLFEGDILLLDEVIAAGDQAFFEKAKNRLYEMIGTAKIIVLATHDMGAAQELCTRGLILQNGQIVFDGPIIDAVSVYRSGKYDRPTM